VIGATCARRDWPDRLAGDLLRVDFSTGGELGLVGTPDAGQRWRDLDQAARSWVELIAYSLTGHPVPPAP
jgi:hypothetical protein